MIACCAFRSKKSRRSGSSEENACWVNREWLNLLPKNKMKARPGNKMVTNAIRSVNQEEGLTPQIMWKSNKARDDLDWQTVSWSSTQWHHQTSGNQPVSGKPMLVNSDSWWTSSLWDDNSWQDNSNWKWTKEYWGFRAQMSCGAHRVVVTCSSQTKCCKTCGACHRKATSRFGGPHAQRPCRTTYKPVRVAARTYSCLSERNWIRFSYEHVHDMQLSKRPVVIWRHCVHEKDGAEQWSVYSTQNWGTSRGYNWTLHRRTAGQTESVNEEGPLWSMHGTQ